jgi:hypothetical protein
MAMPRKLARTLVLTVTLATLGVLASAPTALAYGNTAQWQVGFSGTCSGHAASVFCPTPVHNGFWGWCEFGGSNGDSTVGTIGSQADCQLTTYFGPATSIHISFDVTGWVLLPATPFSFNKPDFLLTSGTLELSGPGAATNPFGLPTGVPVPFPSPCPPGICNTGIPAAAGHYSIHVSGFELNIQVTKLP